ncbi:replication protein [Clostridioides difficile]|uniref:replication protein n=1 Tax=Clostridioides difficile TaxID=1496 RepID=UPI000D1FC4A9|nr:replication protein [Clostridioides difficile]
MAVFRQIYTSFWTDPKVQEEWTPEDKFFFILLLSNPQTTQIGVYQVTKKQLAFWMGYSEESIRALMDRFINHHKCIKYNPDTREIAIKNWGKYNLTKGGKPIVDLLNKELKEVKDIELIKYVIPSIEKSDIRKIFEEYYEMAKNGDSYDTSTIRERVVPRYGDNNNKNKNNNKNNNNNKDVMVVVDKIKSYFNLESKDLEKIIDVFIHTNKGIDYLEEKLTLVKNTENVKSVTGYLIKALKEDYKLIPSKNNKNKFANFEQTFTKYSDDELDDIIKKSQKEKFGVGS